MTDPCRSAGAERRPSSDPHPTFCFAVQAAAEPGVMPRVLGLFAKRNLLPTRCHGAVAGETLQIDLQVPGLDPALGDHIARCLRQIVQVECVLTTVKEREG